jgi:hypothetical protein
MALDTTKIVLSGNATPAVPRIKRVTSELLVLSGGKDNLSSMGQYPLRPKGKRYSENSPILGIQILTKTGRDKLSSICRSALRPVGRAGHFLHCPRIRIRRMTEFSECVGHSDHSGILGARNRSSAFRLSSKSRSPTETGDAENSKIVEIPYADRYV